MSSTAIDSYSIDILYIWVEQLRARGVQCMEKERYLEAKREAREYKGELGNANNDG